VGAHHPLAGHAPFDDEAGQLADLLHRELAVRERLVEEVQVPGVGGALDIQVREVRDDPGEVSALRLTGYGCGGPGKGDARPRHAAWFDKRSSTSYPPNMGNGPLSNDDAKRRVVGIIGSGIVRFTPHALREMKHDRMVEAEVLRVLRSGRVEFSEFEGGEWRYRMVTGAACVVFSFAGEDALVVVTAWRQGR
jgi:hypothetical protein